MYCTNCGVALPQKANFCVDCGAAAEQSINHPPDEHEHLLLEVRPIMITWVILARYIPQQINLTILGSLFFGSLIVSYHIWQGDLVHLYRPFIFFALVFFITVPLIVYLSYKKTLGATRYLFYRDRVEYYEGFWNVEHKVMYYKHISEVTLHRNMIQRLYGVGTIHLAAPGLSSQNRGIILTDIQHPIEIYQKIQQLITEY